jgi:hypothetical protein
MAISLEVLTTLNERSLELASRTIEEKSADVGESAGRALGDLADHRLSGSVSVGCLGPGL